MIKIEDLKVGMFIEIQTFSLFTRRKKEKIQCRVYFKNGLCVLCDCGNWYMLREILRIIRKDERNEPMIVSKRAKERKKRFLEQRDRMIKLCSK